MNFNTYIEFLLNKLLDKRLKRILLFNNFYYASIKLLLLHTAIHMLLISNIIHAYYYEYKYDEDRHSKYDYYVIEEIDNFKSTLF